MDGVFDKDPVVYSDAVRYNNVSFTEILGKNLRVMDLTAITLCKENALPICVFNINNKGDLKRVVEGKNIGTTIIE